MFPTLGCLLPFFIQIFLFQAWYNNGWYYSRLKRTRMMMMMNCLLLCWRGEKWEIKPSSAAAAPPVRRELQADDVTNQTLSLLPPELGVLTVGRHFFFFSLLHPCGISGGKSIISAQFPPHSSLTYSKRSKYTPGTVYSTQRNLSVGIWGSSNSMFSGHDTPTYYTC